MDDREQIEQLIHRWAAAVHDGRMGDVLAGHAEDLVMFDVPPPERGLRGIDAYRDAWPPFFEFQRTACFDVEELHVEAEAGSDLAWAWALLRCGTDEMLAEEPERRLRLTLALRRADDGWVVAHEHHSFTQP